MKTILLTLVSTPAYAHPHVVQSSFAGGALFTLLLILIISSGLWYIYHKSKKYMREESQKDRKDQHE